MGISTRHRVIEHIHSMAVSRLLTVSALEVVAGRTAAAAQEPTNADPHDGRRESELGEGRIADELSLKLGLLVDARTVGKYLKQASRPRPPRNQRWATFVRNYAAEIIACDFFTSVTVRFKVMYVFIVIEIGSRRILHVNVTDHPTAEWTRPQFREFVDGQSGHRYVGHDRDTIFSAKADEALIGFGLNVLKTPVRSPMANVHRERVVGTIRRECLDYLIPMNERQLKRMVREFATYYKAKDHAMP